MNGWLLRPLSVALGLGFSAPAVKSGPFTRGNQNSGSIAGHSLPFIREENQNGRAIAVTYPTVYQNALPMSSQNKHFGIVH